LQIPLIYGKGFSSDDTEVLFAEALEKGVLRRKTKRSPIYLYGEKGKEHEIKGKDNVLRAIRENREFHDWLASAVKTQF